MLLVGLLVLLLLCPPSSTSGSSKPSASISIGKKVRPHEHSQLSDRARRTVLSLTDRGGGGDSPSRAGSTPHRCRHLLIKNGWEEHRVHDKRLSSVTHASRGRPGFRYSRQCAGAGVIAAHNRRRDGSMASTVTAIDALTGRKLRF